MSWWKKISKFFGMITVRNRDARGRYVADDPSTPDVNEAWEGGEAPKTTKKKRTTKKKAS